MYRKVIELKIMKNNIFLAPCCVLVKGACFSCIYDLQRSDIYRFPNAYLSVFREVDTGVVEVCIGADKGMQAFVDDLIQADLCLSSDSRNFRSIAFESDGDILELLPPITNCIIDRDLTSDFSLERCEALLSELRCESLCLRYFYPITLTRLEKELAIFNNSTIRSIELHLSSLVDTKRDELSQLKMNHGRICRLNIYGGSSDRLIYQSDDFVIRIYSHCLDNASQCGQVSIFQMNAQTQFYRESKQYNNCLYKKLSIDTEGHIKNCPSMEETFGHISDETIDIMAIVKSPDFRRYWCVTKDEIDGCKCCEYRYACLDCRCYRSGESIHSKPLKCTYDPIQTQLK